MPVFEPSSVSLHTESVIREWSEEPDVDWHAVLTLAHLSKLAYDDAPTRESRLTELGFKHVPLLGDGTRSGFVAIAGDTAVIAFRGTDDPEDWIANFNWELLPDSDSDRGVHTGFWGEYAAFETVVREELERMNPSRVWITGHSLGGAMATCCAYDFLQKGTSLAGVVTFGQPRIGNGALAKYLDLELGDRYLRLMNHGDPVVILPPAFGIRLPAYWHSGRRAWFWRGKIYANEGPTRFAAPGPDYDEAAENSSDLNTARAEDSTLSITEEEFLELQKQLAADPHKTGVDEYAAVIGSPSVESPTRAKAFVDAAARFVRARFREHNMDQYLRQINDLQSGRAGQ